MLFNPKALFYVRKINNNLKARASVAGARLSLAVFPWPPPSLTLSVSSLKQQGHGGVSCSLLARFSRGIRLFGCKAGLVIGLGMAALPGATCLQHHRVAARRGKGGNVDWKGF